MSNEVTVKTFFQCFGELKLFFSENSLFRSLRNRLQNAYESNFVKYYKKSIICFNLKTTGWKKRNCTPHICGYCLNFCYENQGNITKSSIASTRGENLQVKPFFVGSQELRYSNFVLTTILKFIFWFFAVRIICTAIQNSDISSPERRTNIMDAVFWLTLYFWKSKKCIIYNLWWNTLITDTLKY